ncbi:MAG: hypothetical protein AAB257_02045 [Nitrospinota bacterium]
MKIVMISKALEEVWEWKEKCYEESKGMTILDYLKKVHENADNVLTEIKTKCGHLEESGIIH